MTRKSGQIARDLELNLEREWQLLCEAHLPFRPRGSMWRANRRQRRDEPSQGWKLHIAATILSACEIFRRIAPRLCRDDILFKAPASLRELEKLNSGVDYGFSQVGKFVTIYPPSPAAAVALARELDTLTDGLPAPLIAYDKVLRPGSCVYYRYGPFKSSPNGHSPGQRGPVIVDPNGRRLLDKCEPGTAVPRWLSDPFCYIPRLSRTTRTPLETRFSAYEAILQRGRGGVYTALDHSTQPPRACVIKEGRRHGETDWLGRDGIDRVKREARFLKEVSPVTGSVPQFVTTFRAHGSFYLVMERLPGRALQALITSRAPISTRRTLFLCQAMARIVADIHALGWTWLDCKPDNFLRDRNGDLRALDFESVCPPGASDAPSVATPGYRAPEGGDAPAQADDLYALGVSIAQLVLRQAMPPSRAAAFKTRTPWQKLPEELADVTKSLLHPNPARRPAARMVQQLVAQMLSRVKNSSTADKHSWTRIYKNLPNGKH